MDNDNKHGAGSLQVTENSVIADGADLFSAPLLETSLIDGTTTMYRPLNKSDEGPIEFNIKAVGMKYIHLSQTRLFAQLKVTNADGSNMAEASTAAVANLPLSTIFKNIEIEIAGVPVSELGNNLTNYKAYFETALTYSQSARDSHLRASVLKMDTANQFENFANNDNLGYASRKTMCARSRSFQVCTPIKKNFYIATFYSLTNIFLQELKLQ